MTAEAKPINIQTEVQKIHAKYGMSEKANYEIQLLCERYTLSIIEQAVAEEIGFHQPEIGTPDNIVVKALKELRKIVRHKMGGEK